MMSPPCRELEAVLSDGGDTLVLVAPFIKEAALRRVLSFATFNRLVVYTRWLPAEVAQGVSDLEVLEVVEEAGGELRLMSDLHAKAFLTPTRALVGSANITAAALGWSRHPNLELLVEIDREHPALGELLESLESASVVATSVHRDEIATLAEALQSQPELMLAWYAETIHAQDSTAGATGLRLWVPETTDPVGFIPYHQGRSQLIASAETRARRDLAYLQVPVSEDTEVFEEGVRRALQRTGFYNVISGAFAAGHDSQEVFERFCRAAGLDHTDRMAEEIWKVATRWLSHFFPREFEIRPARLMFGPRATSYGSYG